MRRDRKNSERNANRQTEKMNSVKQRERGRKDRKREEGGLANNCAKDRHRDHQT